MNCSKQKTHTCTSGTYVSHSVNISLQAPPGGQNLPTWKQAVRTTLSDDPTSDSM